MKKNIHITLDENLLKKIEYICVKENRTRSNVIETLLMEILRLRRTENDIQQ